jgi:hypothetical protein
MPSSPITRRNNHAVICHFACAGSKRGPICDDSHIFMFYWAGTIQTIGALKHGLGNLQRVIGALAYAPRARTRYRAGRRGRRVIISPTESTPLNSYRLNAGRYLVRRIIWTLMNATEICHRPQPNEGNESGRLLVISTRRSKKGLPEVTSPTTDSCITASPFFLWKARADVCTQPCAKFWAAKSPGSTIFMRNCPPG